MTYEQVQAQLRDVTYDSAISYYAYQKLQFLQEYRMSLQESQQDMANVYMQDFIDGINNSNLRGQSFGLTKELVDMLESALANALSTAEKSGYTFDSLSNYLNKNYSELTSKGKNALDQELNSILTLSNIDAAVRNFLMTLKLDSNNGVDATDILNWTRSYLRGSFFNQLKGNKYQGNKTIIAGYFEEALVHKATHTLTQHLENKTAVFHTGSKKVKINQHNVDSIFDEYFNFCSQDLSTSFTESISVDDLGRQSLKSGFGGQVKLWSAPGDAKNLKQFYSIANNSSLFAAWPDKKSWIDGVLFLQDKVQNVHGDNVMYILGNKFYWTTDLITRFKEYQYYLAFRHNGNEFTKVAGWEQIDMSKPYK